MTYTFKKDLIKNWDLPQINEKSIIIIDNEDDQDIYISERSSIASSNDIEQTPSLIVKRLPTPTPSPPLSVPQKQSQTLRNNHHDLPDNGVAITNHLQHKQKEDKIKKKTLGKGPSNQKNVSLFPETKSSESGDHHYPHWYYHNVKNHDLTVRHRPSNDNQVIPSESIDPSQYIHQTALSPSSVKPRQHPAPRKIRPNGIPISPSNQNKQRHDHTEKNSSPITHTISHDNHDNNHHQLSQRRSSSKQHVMLKETNNDEHPIKQTISPQRRRNKTENESTDRNLQIRSSKSPQDANGLIITSTSLTNRSRRRSKVTEKNSLGSEGDENTKHRHHHHQNPTQMHNSPSIPSQQNHQHHHHHHHPSHLHVRRRPPSGSYLGAEIQVVDVTFKKPERTTYFQQVRDPYLSPTPSTHNQTPHLPPIIRDHHHKTSTTRFPTEYYGTLARQTQGKDWEETIERPKIYKPDIQARFYDRYLNNVVDKRLAV